MLYEIKNIPRRIVTTTVIVNKIITDIIADHNLNRQIKYFKKHGYEVLEKDEKGKWRKI